MAEKLGLQVNETTGNIQMLEDMLKGGDDQRFIVLKPGEKITEDMF
jgi:hypothetical protein